MFQSRFYQLAGPALFALSVACGAQAEPESAVSTNETEEPRALPPTTDTSSPADSEEPSANSILVVDALGRPVPGAHAVTLDGYYQPLGDTSVPLSADSEGRLTLSLTETQLQDALLLIWAPGHAALRFSIDPTRRARRARLPEATPLRGQLRGQRRGVQHVWLQAAHDDAAWPFFVRADVDEDGRFSALGLEAGTYRVSSRPLGGAPVLAADPDGRLRFLAADPGHVPVLAHRLLDRELPADGQSHAIRVATGRVMVGGQVVDEAGTPIVGARMQLSSERPGQTIAMTDANGRFEASVPPSPNLRLAASHPDFGTQWTDREWNDWSTYDEMPDAPVRLVLRRGAVLHGRLLDETGAPSANQRLLMIPAYVGSGPATVEARTDAQGRFAFERAVLNQFEIVPRSLDEWHPTSWGRAGEHVRVVEEHALWLQHAAAHEAVVLRLQSYTLVPAVVQLTDQNGAPLARRQVQLWTRSAPDQWHSQIPRTDGRGHVRALLERGVSYEFWAEIFSEEAPRTAPWSRGVEPLWTGTPDGPSRLTLVHRRTP